jgi:hypothetical protein
MEQPRRRRTDGVVTTSIVAPDALAETSTLEIARRAYEHYRIARHAHELYEARRREHRHDVTTKQNENWNSLNEVVMQHEHLLNRLRAEYLEMPGMRLTIQQVQRLCGMDRLLCQAMLDALVDAKFLCVKPNGTYARATDADVPRPV